ncbi:MBL fold hydrolase [Alteromonadales bacterium alter-6D02]|nr:MBL fold hydrolase [Alteromonadales bacterium alter-6D02]
MFSTHIFHHGAVNGVTGSCHELAVDVNPVTIDDARHRYVIDCGLFQGAETAGVATESLLAINFSLDNVAALLVTHCHIDHVGRIPYLLAAGFTGPIYCSTATAILLPEVIEDALKVAGFKSHVITSAILKRLTEQLVAVDYHQWQALPLAFNDPALSVKARFQPAGHILGSAFIEFEIQHQADKKCTERVIFSGDLGACYTPLLPAPKPPYRCDKLVIESTYGDANHVGRKKRRAALASVLKRCVADNGVVLIPAFSIGRTQELLYEIEEILHRLSLKSSLSDAEKTLNQIDIIIDSPMAAKFTKDYRNLQQCWDKEARRKVKQGRHPLSFEQLMVVNSHQQHLEVMDYLDKHRQKVPAIIIAASGMCSGGRIVNYLKRFIEQPSTDILFVGYQAEGTPGRIIAKYGPKQGYVYLDNQKYTINAQVHAMSGYSAHADQKDLLRFVKRMRVKPKHIRIVHGDNKAKQTLKAQLQRLLPNTEVVIGALHQSR